MNKTLFWIAVMAVIVVAVVAGVVSYDHLHTVAIAAGEQSWIAKLVPLSADGLLVSASLSAFVAKWQDRKVHGMTKLSLAVGLSASVAANIASPFVGSLTGTGQDILAAIVGAWPAIALALSFEEVLRLSSMWKAEGTTEVAALPEIVEVPQAEVVAMPEAEASNEVAAVKSTSGRSSEVIPEVETPKVEKEVATLPEVASPSVRKSVTATASKPGSLKAEALAYLAMKPNTPASMLAERFGRSDRWARGLRKEFQEAQLVAA
jgi:hypothetical protein